MGLKPYTISEDSTTVTFSPSISSGQRVDFVVLKSIVAADNVTALQLMNEVNTELAEVSTKLTAATNDSGWIDFVLENGAIAFTEDLKPSYRKYGNTVYLRGAIQGVTDIETVLCTLPPAFRPTMDHVFTTSVGGAIINLQILASNGQVKILDKSKNFGFDDMILIATNFII